MLTVAPGGCDVLKIPITAASETRANTIGSARDPQMERLTQIPVGTWCLDIDCALSGSMPEAAREVAGL